MSIFTLVAWAVPLLSATGLAGYIALLIFAHPVAIALEQAAFKLASAILSSRIGCALLAALLAGTVCWWIGDNHGADRVQAEWDAAEHAMIEEGKDARAAAEAEIPPVPADPEAPPAPAPERFHFPMTFNLKGPANACPPVPHCPAARAAGPVPGWMRNDPHHRNDR